MKLSIFKKSNAPTASRTAASAKETFEKKMGALRLATGQPEYFVMACACAVHDRPFAVVYERLDPARPYVISGIYKESEGDVNERAPARSSRSKVLSARDLDTTGWRCPHCDAKGLNIACTACGTTVCGGRTRTPHGAAPVFECRPSCGARGKLEDAEVIKGIEDVRKPVSSFRSALGREAVPAGRSLPPSLDTKRLGGPK